MKKIILFSLLLLLVSCDQQSEYKTITVKDKFSIALPDFLTEAKDLNDQASLQYQNLFKEFYVIVLDETKADFPNLKDLDLNGYSELLKNNLESSLKEIQYSPVQDTVINGLKAKLFSVSGVADGIKIYYEFAYLESDKNFYQILTWTLLDKKETNKEAMKKILTTFKEIKTRNK